MVQKNLKYNLIPNDWTNLEYIIGDMSRLLSSQINETASYIDQDVTNGSSPTFSAANFSDGGNNIIPTTTQETNWDAAYGWGDHLSGGYLTAESDTLATVVARGASAGASAS